MTFSQDLALAAPELILAIGALGLLVIGAFAPRATTALMLASIAALLVAAWAAAVGPIGRGFSGGMISDNASAFAKVAIYIASAIAILLGQKWFERKAIRNFEFPILVLLAALGMGMMASSGDLISLYLPGGDFRGFNKTFYRKVCGYDDFETPNGYKFRAAETNRGSVHALYYRVAALVNRYYGEHQAKQSQRFNFMEGITYENGKFKEAKGDGSESDGSKFTNNFTAVYTNNKVSKITSKMVGIDSADPTVTYDLYTMTSDLTYSGSNLSNWKYKILMPLVPLPTVEINATMSDYDTHVNPFGLLPEVFNIIAAHFETDTYAVMGFSANNYRKINVVSNADNQNANYVYTYDADGYPTKAVAANLATLTFHYQ